MSVHTASSPPARVAPATGRPGDAVRRHPVAAFLVLAFGLGWPLASLPVLAGHGLLPGRALLDSLPFGGEQLVALIVLWLAMVPAALVVTAVVEGGAGVATLARRALRWRFGIGWWLVVVLGLPGIALVVELARGGVLRTADIAGVLASQALATAAVVLIVNLAEETVWAGFLQTRLEQRHGLVVAAALTAVPFAGIHLPLQFLGSPTAGSVLLGTVLLLVLGLVMRLLMGVFRHATRDSLLAVAVLHAVSNATNSRDGLVATLVPGDQPVLGWLVAAVVLTAGAALAVRRRAARRVPRP